MAWIRNRPTGLVYSDLDKYAPGYALAPAGEIIRLLDVTGETVHTWNAPSAVAYARLLAGGNLVVLLTGDPVKPHPIANGGIEGLAELGPDSELLWQHHDDMLHHDAWRLEDGSYYCPGWEPLPPEISARVQGGWPHEDDPEQIWGDVIVHITRDGGREVVWRAGEAMVPEEHPICPIDNRKEWAHMNALRMTRDGHWLASFRMTSTVAKIHRQTGELLWQWGPGQTSHQHDARELDSGNVLMFDNGVHRTRMPGFARIVEVDPNTDQIVWQYMDKVMLAFQSFMGGGAQRLANGNTYITEAATGRLFQVTAEGETVWEWVNPDLLPSSFGPTPVIWRSHWYAPGDPRLPL